jgi:mRNA interferase RelE/StbE
MNEPQRRWTIVIDRQPQKEMRRLPSDLRQRIDRAILALAEDPRPAGCKPVKDAPRGTYRLRVGDYRVIYSVLDAEGVVVVARVCKRDESTYRGL